MKLNKNQKEAVEHGDGPLLIMAGAGTGKTTVIVERIKHLISKGVVNSSEILALTFTEKASREMEERVDIAMPYGYERMWIMTFHSFCDQVLRDDGIHVGFDSSFNLLTQSESIQFMRSNFDKLKLEYYAPFSNPHKFIIDLLTHFSRLADEDVKPNDYGDWVNSKFPTFAKASEGRQTRISKLSDEDKLERIRYKELADAYKTYIKLKFESSVMDFADLITNTLHLFRERPNVLREYREKFKYILVDEYQDTNISQNELVKLLAGNGNITVVADDDQSIYKWRGAAISNVVQFRKSFPETEVVTLTRNYRSNQDILDHAYRLIRHNDPNRLEVVEGVDKKLISSRKNSKKAIEFVHTINISQETGKVVDQIELLVSKFGYDYSDIAILVRANNHAKPFEYALTQSGIPNTFLGPGKLLEQIEVVDLISYLKFMTDPDDSVSLYRLLSSEFLEIDSYDLLRISNYARKKNLNLLACLNEPIYEKLNIGRKSSEKITKLAKFIIQEFKKINTKSAGELLYAFVAETGYLQKLVDPANDREIDKTQNITKLFEKIRNYESTHEDKSVFALIDWIDLSRELGESPLVTESDWSQVNSVKLLTIHSAKGLEFPVVFLVNLVNQRFPSANRSDRIPLPDNLIKEVLPTGDNHLQEERRLFYVGITRAEDKVYLTASDYYGEGKRKTTISPFVYETLGKVDSKRLEVGSNRNESIIEPVMSEPLLITNNPLLITELSYTHIETFKICPLHYKLRYVLRIPTPKTSSLAFGTSIHETLDDYYKSLMKGQEMSRKKLIDRLKVNWINEGYKSNIQEKRSYERGVQYLNDYFSLHKDTPLSTYSTEKEIHATIRDEKSAIKLKGKIDRIDITPSGIEIIDYKTGEKVPSQKDLDRDEQLTFYALLVSKIRQKPYHVDLSNIIFSMYFFKEQLKMTTRRSIEQVENFEKEIFKVKGDIESSDFKCSGNIICKDCEYKLFCSN